jgi:hypothetical protein
MRHEFDDRHHFYEFSAVEYYTCLFNEQTNYLVKQIHPKNVNNLTNFA